MPTEGVFNVGAPSPFDPATLAWVAAVIVNGGTVSNAREILVNNLIVGLKADGLFTKLDRLWLFAGENQPSALTDIVADSLATAVNSPTFTTDRGFTGTDASATIYIDTGFNPSTAGGNYTQNSAHLSAWSNTNAASSSSGGAMIGYSNAGVSQANVFPKFSDGNEYFRINDNVAASGIANANATGHYLSNRSDSTHQQGYRNAVDQGVANGTSAALQNGNFYALATNIFAGPAGDGHQNCMVSIGGSFSSTDVTNFYNLLRTYMTAVGVP